MAPQDILMEMPHMEETEVINIENYPENKISTPTLSNQDLLSLLLGFFHSFVCPHIPMP